MCTGASGVYDAFGDALVVEMGDLIRVVNIRSEIEVR